MTRRCSNCGGPAVDSEFCNERCKDAFFAFGMFHMLGAVHDFQKKFKIPMANDPTTLSGEDLEFRIEFMQEELDEYKRAAATDDLPGQLDALIDLAYVLFGTALMQGFWEFQQGFARVHAANMKKVAGVSTARHSKLDITKPPGWTAPVLDDLVKGRRLR